jgi:hypothetical protein
MNTEDFCARCLFVKVPSLLLRIYPNAKAVALVKRHYPIQEWYEGIQFGDEEEDW